MRDWIADLHVHSLLSPCADLEMTPHQIVLAAAETGVDIIAITDHNASGNVAAAVKAGKQAGVVVLPGMEVETAEEAHLVVVFDNLPALAAWQRLVDEALPPRKNDPSRFGAQMLVDAADEFVAYEERMLLQPTRLTARRVIAEVNALGGLCIASHVDRPAYSLLGKWGILLPDCELHAVEISRRFDCLAYMEANAPLLGGFPGVTNSDAHRLIDFFTGPKTVWHIERPTIGEMRLALQGRGGRKVVSGVYLEWRK